MGKIRENKIIPHDNYVSLYTLNNDEIKIDHGDLELCSNYCWRLDSKGYPIAWMRGVKRSERKCVHLHRLIMGINDSNIDVDHKNGDKLDCRRENLRLSTRQNNNRNRIPAGEIKYPGVGYRKDRNKYRARITVNGVVINLGYFLTQEEAILARISAEEKYFGEFGYYNSRIKPCNNKEENTYGFQKTND